MRYAIVSDIHANLQAWNVTLLDIRSNGVDRIICLGDIVGYGPNPAEVLQSVHANVNHLVLGNHDAVLSGRMDGSHFNKGAQRILQWTHGQLNQHALHFLESLPLTLDGGTFRCTHGDFAAPAAFQYVIEPADAQASWQAVTAPLLFAGHTHQPALFLLGESGIPRTVPPQDFELEPEKRFFVNVGSVGQPRDGEALASYCILDTTANAVFWRRLPFDLDAYRAAVWRTGLDESMSYFLSHDPRAGARPLREMLNFSPPATADEGARGAVEVQKIEVLERKVRRWQAVCASLVILGLALGGAAGYAVWHHATRALDRDDTALAAVFAETVPANTNLLALPPGIAANGAVPGWALHLGDKRRQGIALNSAIGDAPSLTLRSATAREEVRLTSACVQVRPHMKLRCTAAFRRAPGFAGDVEVVILLTSQGKDGEPRTDKLRVKSPAWTTREGWGEVQTTTDPLPATAQHVQVCLCGQFVGEVEVKDLSLVKR
jgi:predicted phosphodiesterase